MVSLTMMARLLEALRPTARLILVGDPDQLASVERRRRARRTWSTRSAPRRSESPVVSLTTTHRFGEEIGGLAVALRDGDADEAVALLRAGGERVAFLQSDDAEPCSSPPARRAPSRSARRRGRRRRPAPWPRSTGSGCCARTATGPLGVAHWNRQVERWLGEATGEPTLAAWYAGRPLLVTANDYGLGIYNGETGVVVRPARGELARPDRRRSARHRARPRHQPARPGRDDARDDDPQEPGQPGRPR